jgi:hypothetical protein
MATSKRQRGNRASQADGSSTADDNDNATSTTTDASTQRSRNNRRGSKTSGADSPSSRRGKTEPGHYQKRDDELDLDSEIDDTPTKRSPQSGNIQYAFDDDDMNGDVLDAYGVDEGDGDIDWDDPAPRRGGRDPDR